MASRTIVFHGQNALTFRPDFETLLDDEYEILIVSDALSVEGEQEIMARADIVIGTAYSGAMPPLSAALYQLPSAGYDGIDFAALPEGCRVCNVFGHEQAIAEYVMCALLSRHVPLVAADRQLREGNWHYWAGKPSGLRTELGAQSMGIVGHGHIGKALAARASAFGMDVHVANRSEPRDVFYAGLYGLEDLTEMMSKVDYVINTLPLADNTRGLIGAVELAAMRPDAIIMNVGRGPVIDEDSLYEALKAKRIGGAILDTWYVYPSTVDPAPMPATRPFHELDNVTMTPHMSGWTHGTIARRQQAMAENVNRLSDGRKLLNQVSA